MITGEDLWLYYGWWTRNWENAKRFFESKGNAKTTARLKKEWMDGFYASMQKAYNAGKTGGE